jgi:hypothetical protein
MYCKVHSTAAPAAVVDVTVDRRAVPSGAAARLPLDVETIRVAAADDDATLDRLREELHDDDDEQQIQSS